MKMANINNQLFQFTQFMDYGLEIVLFFDEEGKVTEGNQTAKNELGYGEEINEISICRIFPNVLKYKEEALSFSDLEIEKSVVQGDKIETVAYRKNQTCFSVDLKVVIKKKMVVFSGCV